MLYQKLGRPALLKTAAITGTSVAEEILQEVFTKLWEKQMTFPNLKAAFAWVYQCCTNAAIDHIRNHNNKHSSLDSISDSESVGIANETENKTAANRSWHQLLKKLTDQEAQLFVYRNLEGLSQDEASEVMQISRRTVNRLQEKLEAKLEKFRGHKHVG
jgi:RNA polymerase sigma factor (sigma-70 family)